MLTDFSRPYSTVIPAYKTYFFSEDVFYSSLSRRRLLNQALAVCLFACLFP